MNSGCVPMVKPDSLTVFTEVIGPLEQLGESMEKESVRLVVQLNWLVSCITDVAQAGLTRKGPFYPTGLATQKLTGAQAQAEQY